MPSGENDISECLCPKLNVSHMLKWKKYCGESARLTVEINYIQWSDMPLGTTYDPKTPFRLVITTPLDLSVHDKGTLISRKQIIISNRKLPTSNLNSFFQGHFLTLVAYLYVSLDFIAIISLLIATSLIAIINKDAFSSQYLAFSV